MTHLADLEQLKGLLDKTEEKLGKKKWGQGFGSTNQTKMLPFDLRLFMSRPGGGHASILLCSQFGRKNLDFVCKFDKEKGAVQSCRSIYMAERRGDSLVMAYRFRLSPVCE